MADFDYSPGRWAVINRAGARNWLFLEVGQIVRATAKMVFIANDDGKEKRVDKWRIKSVCDSQSAAEKIRDAAMGAWNEGKDEMSRVRDSVDRALREIFDG